MNNFFWRKRLGFIHSAFSIPSDQHSQYMHLPHLLLALLHLHTQLPFPLQCSFTHLKVFTLAVGANALAYQVSTHHYIHSHICTVPHWSLPLRFCHNAHSYCQQRFSLWPLILLRNLQVKLPPYCDDCLFFLRFSLWLLILIMYLQIQFLLCWYIECTHSSWTVI